MVLSKRSARPCSEAMFKVPIVSSQVLATSFTAAALKKSVSSGAVTRALRRWVTPFVSRKARVILTTFWSRQCMDQSFGIRSHGNDRRFQIFFGGVVHEFIDIFRGNDDSHSFLRFRNGQFRSVEAFVFLRDFVEVDVEAVCQFADSDRDAAGTKVVAALDEGRNFLTAEHALDFSFRQGIPLLDFSPAGFQRFNGMFLRRARSTAAAVAAGLAAEEDDDIAGKGFFTNDILPRSSPEDGTDFPYVWRRIPGCSYSLTSPVARPI